MFSLSLLSLEITFLQAPVLWLLIGWLGLFLACFLLIWRDFQLFSSEKPWVLLLLLLLLVERRLPLLFFNQEINPDESQLLSQAITLCQYPIYWQSTDGATMGPLSSYYCCLPAILGIKLNYITLRFMGLICLIVTVVTSYFTLSNLFNTRVALLGILPLVVFLAFTQNPEFVHVTNEQLSLSLLGVSFWQFSRLSKLIHLPIGMACLGFVSSLVPFAKLQGTPTALVIAGAAYIWLFNKKKKLPKPIFQQSIIALSIGGVVFPFIAMLFTIYTGVFGDFVKFYLVANIKYGTEDSFFSSLGKLPAFLGRTSDYISFLLSPILLLLVVWVIFSRQIQQRRVLLFAIITFISSLYAILKPGTEFPHYLLYLVFPICLLSGWFIRRLQIPWISMGIVLCVTAPVIAGTWETHKHDKRYNLFVSAPNYNRQTPQSAVSQTILSYAKAGEPLVVWGWMPRYNVETQMPQGVCDNHTIRCVLGKEEDKRMHQERYVKNIMASKPPVFVDAVGQNCVWLKDRATQAHEVIPALKAYIAEHYTFWGEVDFTRIYIRNDRYTRP